MRAAWFLVPQLSPALFFENKQSSTNGNGLKESPTLSPIDAKDSPALPVVGAMESSMKSAKDLQAMSSVAAPMAFVEKAQAVGYGANHPAVGYGMQPSPQIMPASPNQVAPAYPAPAVTGYGMQPSPVGPLAYPAPAVTGYGMPSPVGPLAMPYMQPQQSPQQAEPQQEFNCVKIDPKSDYSSIFKITQTQSYVDKHFGPSGWVCSSQQPSQVFKCLQVDPQTVSLTTSTFPSMTLDRLRGDGYDEKHGWVCSSEADWKQEELKRAYYTCQGEKTGTLAKKFVVQLHSLQLRAHSLAGYKCLPKPALDPAALEDALRHHQPQSSFMETPMEQSIPIGVEQHAEQQSPIRSVIRLSLRGSSRVSEGEKSL